MDKKQAYEIIRKTFESPFEKDGFIFFIKNLLNKIDEASFIYRGKYIPESYREYISTLERVGKFNDGQNFIDILIVKLKKETSLEWARTKQRNFIAWYLNGSRGNTLKDAALVAFVSPGKQQDWRFSLVKMDYKFEKKKFGKVKVKEEFTPARRWSFLVGANERSHTAQSRLVKILANDEQSPTLLELEKAFDIETVTKEFFLKYRELFIRTKEELDKIVKADKKAKSDFESKGINTVDFAKKLLGQIVFLYFLQKKGWFGVERDKAWGTGSKRFLRDLFEKKHGDYKNFFNDTLEPLFYDALSRDRSDIDHWNDHFKCKIPFLNGGLFDPIGGYSWHKTDIFLSDELFSNSIKTKEGDQGNGILDVFDRYNFTVKEDEPLEKEVAIDPELLGKAYEKFNAIRPDNFEEYKKALKTGSENRFNKKFGVYYTPREIVHYMCQQSLINYLKTELDVKVNKSAIETVVEQGEHLAENEAIALKKEPRIAAGQQKTARNRLFLDKTVINNAELIDRKLKEITVCDPAVGSGAFPVGMMSLIVKTRNLLSLFINDNHRTIYDFKRQCIEKSLYGVDIDPGAVEIAKLRLWLSLVVDEQDVKNIKPLPNLDYRIMQGNSLISEFMGIDFDSYKKSNGNLIFKDKIDELVEDFQQKKDRFLNEPNTTRKQKLKKEIDELLVIIFETKLKRQKSKYFKALKRIEENGSRLSQKKQRENYMEQEKDKLYKKTGFNLEATEQQLEEFTSGKRIKPFFLWNLYFSEVFHKKGGFDIVIANPPYVSTKGREYTDKEALKKEFGFVDDLYSHFYFKAFDISIKNKGIVVFISSKTFWTIQTKENLRQLFLGNKIIEIFDTANPFEAMVDTCVLLAQWRDSENSDYSVIVKDGKQDLLNPLKYEVSSSFYKNAVNNVFFIPNKFNTEIYKKYNHVVKALMEKWWDKIRTSRDIEKHESELKPYRQALNPGDVTLLGLITEGGQGLATANNGKYVGVLEGTKYAENIKMTRPKKLLQVISSNNIKKLKHIKNYSDADLYLGGKSETEIRKLFDQLKDRYGRDIFGQGYLFRIVSKNEIANIDALSEEEKKKGIKGGRTFVPYDKGDKEGNRWYLKTPYYIDWSIKNVGHLSKDPKARWQGYNFYFREGFCWSDIHTILIKSRLKSNGVYDVKSMSLFSLLPNMCPERFLISILNSTFISEYDFNFVNNTQTFQINDARQIPIIIPTQKQLSDFENVFNRAYSIKKRQFEREISNREAKNQLAKIQKNLDSLVFRLYDFS